jgi:hypothetical protein
VETVEAPAPALSVFSGCAAAPKRTTPKWSKIPTVTAATTTRIVTSASNLSPHPHPADAWATGGAGGAGGAGAAPNRDFLGIGF